MDGAEGDSNPHELPHTPLKRARLTVSPLRRQRTMLLTSLMRFFYTAKFENAARITFRCNRPPTSAVTKKALKVWRSRLEKWCPVHFFDGSEFLDSHPIHLSDQNVLVTPPHPTDPECGQCPSSVDRVPKVSPRAPLYPESPLSQRLLFRSLLIRQA